ncbi:MAG: hypothetical protein JWQ73_2430 [Variovorax sp.]|nr:hypothetical protein [Variovorax sp.]
MSTTPHDRAPRYALMAVGGLLLSVALVAGGVFWTVRHGPSTRSEDFASIHATARDPVLQTAPQPDLGAYRTQKQAELDSVGPIAGEPGFVRIPLARAMALVGERGLRARPVPDGARP